MSINYYIKNSTVDKVGTRLFDIKSASTGYGKDIDLNVMGSVDRIVGLDKLQQQTEKIILVKKGTYPGDSSLGTNLSRGVDDSLSLNSDIKDSLAAYANIQQRQKDTSLLNILGKNVYRTVDIEDPYSWKKINEHITTTNEFFDADIITGTQYYYGLTTAFRDTSNSVKESQIESYKSISVSAENTMSAKIDSDFILVAGSRTVTLYWNLPIGLTYEEQLRSILGVTTTKSISEPRRVRIDIKLTNRDLTESQITAIGV